MQETLKCFLHEIYSGGVLFLLFYDGIGGRKC